MEAPQVSEREELLRAGLFGVHEVVVVSLNKVLTMSDEELGDDEGKRHRFRVYSHAVVAFCQLFVRNNDDIFAILRDWGQIPGFEAFLGGRRPSEELVDLLAKADEANKSGGFSFFSKKKIVCSRA